MGEVTRTVEVQLVEEATERANRSLSRLVQLLFESPGIAQTKEGQQFMESLFRYVQLKRKRARWYSKGYLESGFRSPPTQGEIEGARLSKNYWLAWLSDTFGEEEAKGFQARLGHRISGAGWRWRTG